MINLRQASAIRIFLFLGFILFSDFSYSQNIYRLNDSPPDETEAEEEVKTFGDDLLDAHEAISDWFKDVADGLDLWIVGKRVTKRENETRVQVINNSFSSEGVPVTNETLIAAMPRFPNLEEFFKLTFTTYDERADRRGVNQNYLRNQPRDRNYGTTLNLFQRFDKVRVNFQPRIELQDPLRVSHSLSFESVAKWKNYDFNPKLELFANPTSGTGLFGALNFHFDLTKRYSLTQINQGTYEEKPRFFSTIHGLSLGEAINDMQSLSYGVIFLSNNRPQFHLEMYSFSVTFSQVLYKEILDLRLIPHLDFPLSNNFKGIAGVTMSLILTF